MQNGLRGPKGATATGRLSTPKMYPRTCLKSLGRCESCRYRMGRFYDLAKESNRVRAEKDRRYSKKPL